MGVNQMREIIFVTSNKFKVDWARKKLKEFGMEVTQRVLPIPEVTEFEVEKVALAKAKYAMKYIQKPFIVDDTGFQIFSLKNFPGTQLKFVLSSIGAEGLCLLARDKPNKKTNLKSVLIYVDENRKIHEFVCNDYGKMSDFPIGNNRNEWGDVMKIHIPDGFKKTLAEMDDNEFKEYENKICKEEHYVKLGRWLTKR